MTEISVPLIDGDITVHGGRSDDSFVFVLGSQAGPVRFALPAIRSHDLITAIAAALSRQLPEAGDSVHVARTTGWAAATLPSGDVGVSFGLLPAGALTFRLDLSGAEGLAQTLLALIGKSTLPPRDPRAEN